MWPCQTTHRPGSERAANCLMENNGKGGPGNGMRLWPGLGGAWAWDEMTTRWTPVKWLLALHVPRNCRGHKVAVSENTQTRIQRGRQLRDGRAMVKVGLGMG